MTRSMKTAAAALTGAVVLASGAYAIGTQVGGGTAGAAPGAKSEQRADQGSRVTRFRGREDLSSLADRLGVTEDRLREALDAVRDALPRPQDPRAAFAEDLAGALDKPVGDVTAALEQVEGRRGGPLRRLGALARALGVERAELRRALRQIHEARREAHRAAFAAALAKELGLGAAEVEEALGQGGPGLCFGRGGGPRGHGGPGHHHGGRPMGPPPGDDSGDGEDGTSFGGGDGGSVDA